jgi:RNA polymerase sigma-70 factor (ECF subfamily)
MRDVISAETIAEGAWQDLARALRSYVGRRVANREDRDDLVQDVLLRVHRGLDGLKGREAPGPWIYRIAQNAVVDHWRRKGRPASVAADEAEAALGKLAVPDDDGDRLQQTLAAYVASLVPKLPSPYRETLELTELQGLTNAEAARRLGASLAAVKSRVLRGRKLLRQAVAECCALEIGATGRVVDCTPSSPGSCGICA